MTWIKRNLFFLVGSAIALILMGWAGYYLLSKWRLNSEALAKLTQDYAELATYNNQNPHPGFGGVDNIKAAKDQQVELRALCDRARKVFRRIDPIPNQTNVADGVFATELSRTLDRLRHDAANASVSLPNVESGGYGFSFDAEKSRVSFAPGSIQPLSIQLGEISAICDVLFAAKINALELIRREPVSADDRSGSATDYLAQKSVTNNQAVLTPYEVCFSCFTPELAAVMAGFASSPYGLVVKAININPAPASAAPDPIAAARQAAAVAAAQYAQQQMILSRRQASAATAYDRAYGHRSATATPQPAFQTMPTAGYTLANRGPQIVLDERKLKVVMVLNLVKLQP